MVLDSKMLLSVFPPDPAVVNAALPRTWTYGPREAQAFLREFDPFEIKVRGWWTDWEICETVDKLSYKSGGIEKVECHGH